MRFLADAGISPRTVEHLRTLGHDVAHVRELGLQRAEDVVLIGRADTEHRILLTFDLDFDELMALGVRTRPSVVIFRLRDETADTVNRHLDALLEQHAATLESGALALVEDAQIRLRNLPIRTAE